MEITIPVTEIFITQDTLLATYLIFSYVLGFFFARSLLTFMKASTCGGDGTEVCICTILFIFSPIFTPFTLVSRLITLGLKDKE